MNVYPLLPRYSDGLDGDIDRRSSDRGQGRLSVSIDGVHDLRGDITGIVAPSDPDLVFRLLCDESIILRQRERDLEGFFHFR